MPLSISFNNTDVKLIDDLNTKISILGPVLVERMTYVMRQLQERARALAPRQSGALASRIRDPRATVEGSVVTGSLTWGGGLYDIPLERGGRGTYVIRPLTEKGTKGSIVGGLFRTKQKGATLRTGSDVLQFHSKWDGRGGWTYADYLFHPPQVGRHFMEQALDSMRAPALRAIRDTILGVVSK